MKSFELYALSFIEPIDVIDALDHENAELIQLLNAFEEIREELLASGVSMAEMAKMRS